MVGAGIRFRTNGNFFNLISHIMKFNLKMYIILDYSFLGL